MVPNIDDENPGGGFLLSPLSRRLLALMPRHVAILGFRPGTGSLSVLVANAVEHLAMMLWDALPDLSHKEWLLLCNTYRGELASTQSVMFIESAVFEEGSDIAERLGVDLCEFVTRISELSICERVAVAEFVNRFWNWKELSKDAKDYEEIIERVKNSLEYTASLGNSSHPNVFSPIARY